MATSKTRRVTAYVVHRRDWFYTDEYFAPLDPGTAVQTFLSREKAEAYRRQKELAARQAGEHSSPFELQGLDWDDWCSLSQAEFDGRMIALGVDTIGREAPYIWWDNIEGELTDEQKNAIWDLLDQISLFEVVETEVELEE